MVCCACASAGKGGSAGFSAVAPFSGVLSAAAAGFSLCADIGTEGTATEIAPARSAIEHLLIKAILKNLIPIR
jgi:hypothetical protein